MRTRRIQALPVLVLALLPLTGGCGRAGAPPGQGLVLEPDTGPLARGVTVRDPRLNFHDFGRVRDGERVSHVFRLHNTDPVPVSITKVDPGCGCTVASLRVIHADGSVEKGEPIRSKAPKLLTVAPGEIAEIEVGVATLDSATKNRDKLITLRILTDSPNGYFITLEVHILIEQPFTAVPASIALGNIPENGGADGRVEIVQAGGFSYELGPLEPPPPGVHASLVKELRVERPVWILSAGFDAPLARGPRNEVLRIGTLESEGVSGPPFEVPLTALVVADLAAQPERLVFAAARDVPAHTSCEFFSRLAGQRLRVTGLELPADQRALLRASYAPTEADDSGASARWNIALETVPPLPAAPMLTGKLVVRLDDPQHPSCEIEYVVHVR